MSDELIVSAPDQLAELAPKAPLKGQSGLTWNPDPRDLVTKAQVEAFLNSNNASFNTTSDTVNIPTAITAVSQDWLTYCGRRTLNRFLPCNDFFDGSFGDRQFLREFPVAMVTGVWINGTAIPQGGYSQNGAVQPGWALDQKRESISLMGFTSPFWGLRAGSGSGGAYAATGGPLMRQWSGLRFGASDDSSRQNVQVAYFAGGSIMDGETVQVPASPGPYTVPVNWASAFYMDIGVMYALPQGGQLVTLVAVPGSPQQGQYSVSAAGLYTFNAADAGQWMAFRYAYNAAPPEIQQYAIIQIAETLKKRQTIGLKSQGSPETGTTSYLWDVVRPSYVAAVMNKYKRAFVGM